MVALIWLFGFWFICSFRCDLIFQEPEYPLQSPNFTIGGLFPTGFNGTTDTTGIEQLLASICTLECFNRGQGEFPFSGNLNLIAYDSTRVVFKSQAAAMKLLGYNFKPANSSNDYVSDTEIGAILGSLTVFQYMAMVPIFRDFFFPVVGIDFLGYGIPLAQYPGFEELKPRNVPAPFVISTAASFAMATGVVQLLQSLNWTLSTVLYGPDIFGMEGQAILPTLYPTYGLTQACSTILIAEKIESVLEETAACLKERKLRVIVYWSGEIGVNITNYLQEQLGGSLIYIFTGKYALQVPNSRGVGEDLIALSPFPSSFVFDYPVIVFPEQCLRNCINYELNNKLPSDLVNQYWENKFNCSLGALNCPTSLSSTDYDPFAATTAYDATSLVIKCISLMQNNCSLLNELTELFRIARRRDDYCALTSFKSTDISTILSLILYLGYGAFLNLGNESGSKTAPMSIALYQIQQNNSLEVVGAFTTKLFLNESALYWSDGQVPISEIPVVNPNFEYAIVVVFFSFSVTGLIFSWLIFIAFIIYRNEPEIRKSSLLIGFGIKLGIDLLFNALISSGVTYTTSICFSITWSLLLGCGLIIGGMLAKTWRIYRIFTNPDAKAIQLTDKRLAIIASFVVALELLLLALYSFPSGLLGPKVVQSTSDIYYRYRICMVPSEAYQLTWIIIIYAVNGTIVVILAILTFLTRKVDAAFSESKSNSLSIYTIISMLIIFLPLLYTSQDSTNSIITQYTVMGIIILCSGYFLLLVVFMPRLWPIIARRRANETNSRN